MSPPNINKLSPRIQWLRDYYFQGAARNWNNEYTSWSTGTPWDTQYEEMNYYIAPENYAFFDVFRSSFKLAARNIPLPVEFWDWSLMERRAWFNKSVIKNHLPQELLPNDLIAGSRFNIQTSKCLSQKESKKRDRLMIQARERLKSFHDRGYGNAGATSGHLIPDHERVLKIGWQGIHAELQQKYKQLTQSDIDGEKGAQLRAMIIASTMPGDLAKKYAAVCHKNAQKETNSLRRQELLQMAQNLNRVPWFPSKTFWEALQALWINHCLIMSDENYPGPGVSFGRIDQYLYPYWQYSKQSGMTDDFAKELLKCFWVHANTVYDAFIRTGKQGVTSGFGQLITLSGLGADGNDATNELTYLILDVVDDMSPILEPKPNVRISRKAPEKLLNRLIEMIANSQGAPFLLNFDERSMAGLLYEAEKAGKESLINKENVYNYAPVGCLENTMQGNDRSGTVDVNINLYKAVELALTGGKDLIAYKDIITQKKYPMKQDGPKTTPAEKCQTWEQFYEAFKEQLSYIIHSCVDLYEGSESIRATFSPTPYLSCLVGGCLQKATDITRGGAELSFVTINAVTFASTVDALLAVKYLIFDTKTCSILELIEALKDNWEGQEILQAKAKNKAPKYGQDNDISDSLAADVMRFWSEETWKYKTKSTNRQFRPGMLSWNYWVADGYILAAGPDGRKQGQFLSNAICPANGSDINGPTANTNSVGKVISGTDVPCNYEALNILPGGASHTMTFHPAMFRNVEQKSKFKAFIRAYAMNGGTALQINVLDAETLKDAQKNPRNYPNLLVRVTGYNAYFTAIGKELQDEIIARVCHGYHLK
jgi:formate C-acetyltransferase